jgi:hypothetical protein
VLLTISFFVDAMGTSSGVATVDAFTVPGGISNYDGNYEIPHGSNLRSSEITMTVSV